MSNQENLNSYVVQLTERMRDSANNLPDPNVVSEFDEESLPEELKMFADVERYLQGKAKPIAVITGIETEAFPPAEKLTDAQTTFLYEEMQWLLNAFCFYADFPKGLPIEIKYRLLREKWNEKAVYTGEGMTHFEFCYYEPGDCPFPEEFCGCKDFENDDMDDFDMDTDDDEMPF